ncbi:MOSC domain-containing protein [Yoonia sp. 208BN28-4]|uniref:MOSC domain-containing protein n=1 Tax=Yoonia sp. 208BN28-4 TaxID=3126505 RepID=UPI00309A2CA8
MRRTHAQAGRLDWIGLRPARYAALLTPATAEVTEAGLRGDHSRAGKRAVTLLQAEHLPVIAALAGLDSISPHDLRRNLLISGINLLAIRQGRLRIGQVVLNIEGPCPPCSRMEKTLGRGAYNAMRGHGGWYASVTTPGTISVGDSVLPGDVES